MFVIGACAGGHLCIKPRDGGHEGIRRGHSGCLGALHAQSTQTFSNIHTQKQQMTPDEFLHRLIWLILLLIHSLTES